MNKINAICFISAFCIFTFTIVGCDGGCKDTEITDTPDEGSTDQSQIQDQPSDLENIDSISSDSESDAIPQLPPGWTVFKVIRNYAEIPMGPNLLINPSFEEGDENTAEGWSSYVDGYSIDTNISKEGTRAVRLHSESTTDRHGIYQSIVLNQTEPRPIYFSGWSRSENVTGDKNNDYSIYIDITYHDDSHLYGQTAQFPIGTNDWNESHGIALPEKPIKRLNFYLLLRETHTGTVWFDQMELHEILADVFTFDGTNVFIEPQDSYPFEDSRTISISTEDGLSLTTTEKGAVITTVSTPSGNFERQNRIQASGFFIRDVARNSDFIHPKTILTESGTGTFEIFASDDSLQIDIFASIASQSDRIEANLTAVDKSGSQRALTIYFGIPLNLEGWSWGDDIRTTRTIPPNGEMQNTVRTGFGATGTMSRYPFASVSNADSIGIGYPLDSPAVIRLGANSPAGLLYFAWDFALTNLSKEPNLAHSKFVLFRHDAKWKFRKTVEKYYKMFPQFFEKRVEKEGIWVAFSDLSPITNIEDFSIAFHELGSTSQIAFDDGARVLSLRYIAEPWSYWMTMDSSIPNDDYDSVIAVLQEGLTSSNQTRKNYCEATMSSGIFDENGKFVFEPAAEPWCPYGAVFTLNSDPDITNPQYPLNKAHLHWNDNAKQIYSNPSAGILDGEYIDSLEAKATSLDYREEHFSASDLPLIYDSSYRPAIPLIFSTYEFARWIGEDVHAMGKLMMANGALFSFAFPAHIFDIMGAERNWLRTGEFSPDRDSTFNFWRTMSYQKPYCLLMNTDFSAFDHQMVERYFAISLFYGVYPGMFSHNAAEDRYWDDPALVERDRDLFKFYIPLIITLNEAGWEPVTYATASDPAIYVERYGNSGSLYFTVRNTSDSPVTYRLEIEAEELGLPSSGDVSAIDLLSSTSFPTTNNGTILTIEDTINGGQIRMIQIHR